MDQVGSYITSQEYKAQCCEKAFNMKLLQTLTMFVCHNRVPTKTLSLFDLEDNAALCSIVGLTFSHICNAVISEDMEKRLVRKGIGVVLKAP